jgi:hypothetical protein
MRLALLLLVPLLGASWGCASHPTLAFSNVPSPVLLGPVDRIGGGVHAAAATNGRFSVELERKQVATRYSSRGHFDNARKASFAALDATNARKDVDVHLDEVKAGSWFFSAIAGHWREEWVSASGDVRSVP